MSTEPSNTPFDTTRPGVTLRGSGAVVVTPPSGASGIAIGHALTRVEGFTVQGGLPGLMHRRLVLRVNAGEKVFITQGRAWRQAEDPVSARKFLLRTALFASLCEAKQIA